MIKEAIYKKKSSNQENLKNQGSDNKQGWEIKKLGEVVNIINGRNQSAVSSESGQYPIYGSAGNLMGYATDYLCEEGTTIIGRKGNISNPIYIEEKFWNVDTAFGLYPKNGYEPKFINYLCQTIDFKSRNRGTTIPSLVKSDLLNIDVPFISSLPEQQRIVSILDEAFLAIERSRNNAEQNLKNAKELFESYLEKCLNPDSNDFLDNPDSKKQKKSSNQDNQKNQGSDKWEVKRLGEVIEYDKNQNTHKRLSYVGLEHIESNSGRFIGSLEPQVVKSSTFFFNEQHVLYGRLRPYLNKVLLPDFEGHCSTEIFPIKVGKQIAREFLFYWLISGSTAKKIDSTWTGARMPRANMNQVLEFDFAFPPLKTEQQTIVRQLDALRAETQKLEAVYQQKIADLDELKKSILQKAFAGELKVSESGLAGLKDEQDLSAVKKSSKSLNHINPNSDKNLANPKILKS